MLTELDVCFVEAEQSLKQLLQSQLTFIGHRLVDDPEEADLVILGSGASKPEQYRKINYRRSVPPIVVGVRDRCDVDEGLPLTAAGGGDGALDAWSDWPLSLDTLLPALRAAATASYQRCHRNARTYQSLVGNSPAMRRVREMMDRVRERDVTVLITGESGTGKEVVARSLHEHSPRRNGPFVPVNCGAIPTELLESELFGHVKGAFTGAVADRVGRFELADGGTIFLDEIGDLPLLMQVKLLRAIQERTFERVGGTRTISTDVRIICATHHDLEARIATGEFREDLFYRINVFPIEMPPLRVRVGDLPALINELTTRLDRVVGADNVVAGFDESAMQSLKRHDWKGNVRELANLVERLAIMYPRQVISVHELPGKFQHASPGDAAPPLIRATEVASCGNSIRISEAAGDPTAEGVDRGLVAAPLLPVNGIDLKAYLTGLERSLIEQALDDSDAVVARAADRLQIRRTTLVEKMRKYGLGRSEARAG